MKKNIFLIGLTLILLLFTGCDAILYSAYPDYDPNIGYFGENTIFIEIEVDDHIDIWNGSINIALVEIYEDGTPDMNNIWIMPFNGINYIATQFDNLRESKFRVFAFQDKDYDGLPGVDEPSIELMNDSNYEYYTEIFDFRITGDNFLNSWGYLYETSRMSDQWISIFNNHEAAYNVYNIWGTIDIYNYAGWNANVCIIDSDNYGNATGYNGEWEYQIIDLIAFDNSGYLNYDLYVNDTESTNQYLYIEIYDPFDSTGRYVCESPMIDSTQANDHEMPILYNTDFSWINY